jgi:hypothetical protein
VTLLKNIYISLILFAIALVPVGCFGNELDCKRIINITPQSFWFNSAELNLMDPIINSKGYPEGRFKSTPEVCFRAMLGEDALLKKTRGYKIAIEKWMSLHELAFRPENWKTEMNIRKRIFELTGQLFQNKAELKRWWKENEKYLIWSESSNKLVVDPKAKVKKRPVSENPREEIKEEYYWYIKAKEHFFDEWQDEAWIYGQAFIEDAHSVIFNAKIHASAKKDRKAKKNGFTTLVGEYAYYYNDGGSPKLVAASIFYRLKKITGVDFKSMKKLKKWWNQNKDHLALSEDGERLIVRR